MAPPTHRDQGARLIALGWDANDPVGLAHFWATALRWPVGADSGDEVALVPTDATAFRIVFRPVAGQKAGKNRIHLDLTTASLDDQRETVETLLQLGARHIDVGQGPDERHVVLADPEGNELCVIEPENSFLADCGRLGSITCDGSPENGYFWSAALDWPLVWDRDGETAVRSPGRIGLFITWGSPVPPKVGTNRLHLDVGPADDRDVRAEIERLVSLGATRDGGGRDDVAAVVLEDPDGNELWVLRP